MRNQNAIKEMIGNDKTEASKYMDYKARTQKVIERCNNEVKTLKAAAKLKKAIGVQMDDLEFAITYKQGQMEYFKNSQDKHDEKEVFELAESIGRLQAQMRNLVAIRVALAGL